MIHNFLPELKERWTNRRVKDEVDYKRLIDRAKGPMLWDADETVTELMPIMARLGKGYEDVAAIVAVAPAGGAGPTRNIVVSSRMPNPNQPKDPIYLDLAITDPQRWLAGVTGTNLIAYSGQDKDEFESCRDVVDAFNQGSDLPKAEKIKILTRAGIKNRENANYSQAGSAEECAIANPAWKIKYAIAFADAILRRPDAANPDRVDLIKRNL